jgi:hypothetical protein
MALSGSSGAYYRANSLIPSTLGLNNADTIHCFVRSTAAPSTSNYRIPFGYLGGNGPGGAQRPHESIDWNHMSASFYKSRQHRSNTDTYVSAQLTTTPSVNTWYSIASTFDGTNARIYLNGALEGTSVATTPSHVSDVYVDVLAQMTFAGVLDNATQFLEGQVAECAIWSVALNADEIAALAKGFRARLIRRSQLEVYYPSVRDLHDLARGRTMVLTGAGSTVVTDHPRVIG